MGLLVLWLILSSCSSGLRIKNLLNVPIVNADMAILDTLKIQPQFLKYTGDEVKNFRSFRSDIKIQGRLDKRPLWMADDAGCFEVVDGAVVQVLDFNFSNFHNDTTMIWVRSGTLILQNCDFSAKSSWAIQVDSSAILQVINGNFTDFAEGAIFMKGGQVRLNGGQFDNAGRTAVLADEGQLFETHQVDFRNTMGTAITLNSVDEVWLDSTHISDSFQDGLSLVACEYVLLSGLESRGNGRHGINIMNTSVCGIVNYSGLGNLVDGLSISHVDTLRILNSELVANGESGGRIVHTLRARLAGISVGHNAVNGLRIVQGNELFINNSSFQANPHTGLVIDTLSHVELNQLSLVSNGNGISIQKFDSLSLARSLFSQNGDNAIRSVSGKSIWMKQNLVKNNGKGLVFHQVQTLTLDSNRVEFNTLGCDIRSTHGLIMNKNIWQRNKSGSYLSDMGQVKISGDQWLNNSSSGVEVLFGEDLTISGATFINNPTAALFNSIPVLMESCIIDSSSNTALKILTGSIRLSKSNLRGNALAIELSEGSRARIVQSTFLDNVSIIKAQPSVSLYVAFCRLVNSREGIQIGNYGEVELLSNHFELIDDYCIQLKGPHLQSLLLRQNVVTQTGGILKSLSNSGKINIRSNTFANNLGSLEMKSRTLSHLDHNIFYKTPLINTEILMDMGAYTWNCFFPQEKPMDLNDDENLYTDPLFDSQFYLKPQSACLDGGENGLLIGALGSRPETKPILEP